MKRFTPIILALTMLAIAPSAFAQEASPTPGSQMMQPHRHRGQMLEKLAAACNGKKENDPCTFTRRNGSTANGTCETRRSELLCIPTGMMHHGAMGGMGHMGGAMSSPAAAASPAGQ
jgi:hypothetical protein